MVFLVVATFSIQYFEDLYIFCFLLSQQTFQRRIDVELSSTLINAVSNLKLDWKRILSQYLFIDDLSISKWRWLTLWSLCQCWTNVECLLGCFLFACLLVFVVVFLVFSLHLIYVSWPIVAKFNLNHRDNFKPHLNFIFDMKIESKFTFQIDIRNQVDFYFYLHILSFICSILVD